jgi:nicotinamide riboside transporter PnuC
MEWIGSLSSLLGAFLIATHSELSQYGWVAFIIANLALITFSLSIKRYGLLLQQAGFTVTSLIGLYHSGLI